MKEIWKNIDNCNGIYKISNYGNVKSLMFNKEKLLKLSITTTGYYRVNLHINGVQKTRKIHQLVAIAFLNHKPNGFNGLIVDHIDNNKLNNNLDNLQLVTNRHNSSKDKFGYLSKYIGVSFNKKLNKWNAAIQINGKSKHLGYFVNEYDAYLKYQNELKAIRL